VLNAPLEVVLDPEVSCGAERCPINPPTSGASGNRKISPIRTPQNMPLRVPHATAW
jgi:hypothetical protein